MIYQTLPKFTAPYFGTMTGMIPFGADKSVTIEFDL